VEHVNQLQGLSWLPWFLVATSIGEYRNRRSWLSSILAIALLFSLQLFAGHTQTAFITGVGLAIWQLARMLGRYIARVERTQPVENDVRSYLTPFAILVAGVLLALVMTAVQLLPTLELTQLSSRQGGLPVNEVLSFSLPPLLLSRTLLPAYGQSLFSEYVAFLPLIVLALAFIGAWQWRRTAGVLPALVWVVFGYWLALGVYNPLYWLLARVPGFNLFRAPARWMVLYALGVSLLAGVGWQMLVRQVEISRRTVNQDDHQDALHQTIIRPLRLFLIFSAFLFAWGLAGQYLTEMIPSGPEAPYEAPSFSTLLLWAVEWLLLASVLIFLSRKDPIRWRHWIPGLIAVAGVIVLYIGSRTLPYNNLTTPEAYFDLRPPVSRLQAETTSEPARFLSLSDIFFESGDQAEIDSIYEEQLPVAAQYDYTVSIKQKEIVAPNLPMNYGLLSVDGFDGGILPMQSFSHMMKLILPERTETTDGRLREHLRRVPEGRWLDLFNARYLITDKVGDLWRDGVFFDRQHATVLQEGQMISVGYLPDYEATELRLLASQQPGSVSISTIDGENWELVPEKIDEDLFGIVFPTPAKLTELKVSSCLNVAQCELEAITLVDSRDDTFQALVPGAYRMIHSGDVKIYENLDMMPRAFIVHDWRWVSDMSEAITMMRSQDFDVRNTAVLIVADTGLVQQQDRDVGTGESQVEMQLYSSERVVLTSDAAQDGLLLLTDSYYPGWKAAVDGQVVPIQQADGLFRGVFVPAGQHEVVFDLDSKSYNYGRAVSFGGLAVITILIIILAGTRKKPDA